MSEETITTLRSGFWCNVEVLKELHENELFQEWVVDQVFDLVCKTWDPQHDTFLFFRIPDVYYVRTWEDTEDDHELYTGPWTWEGGTPNLKFDAATMRPISFSIQPRDWGTVRPLPSDKELLHAIMLEDTHK